MYGRILKCKYIPPDQITKNMFKRAHLKYPKFNNGRKREERKSRRVCLTQDPGASAPLTCTLCFWFRLPLLATDKDTGGAPDAYRIARLEGGKKEKQVTETRDRLRIPWLRTPPTRVLVVVVVV